MSDQNRKVTMTDSKERVALDLMAMILNKSAEAERLTLKEKDFRDLYLRCRLAAYGYDAETHG